MKIFACCLKQCYFLVILLILHPLKIFGLIKDFFKTVKNLYFVDIASFAFLILYVVVPTVHSINVVLMLQNYRRRFEIKLCKRRQLLSICENKHFLVQTYGQVASLPVAKVVNLEISLCIVNIFHKHFLHEYYVYTLCKNGFWKKHLRAEGDENQTVTIEQCEWVFKILLFEVFVEVASTLNI